MKTNEPENIRNAREIKIFYTNINGLLNIMVKINNAIKTPYLINVIKPIIPIVLTTNECL